MQNFDWQIVPGWIAALGLMASQIAYFNRWIGRQETKADATKEVADKAHSRIDLIEEREEICRQHLAINTSKTAEAIGRIEENIDWIKEMLKKKI